MAPIAEPRARTRTLAGVLVCSASAIGFEITLTRAFSISLSHHFAFMVISIAMLGLGLGGTALALWANLGRRERLGPYALYLAVSILLGFAVSNLIDFNPSRLGLDPHQALYVSAYYLLLGAPFLFFGLIVSSAFAIWSEDAPRLYGADLIGAGAGSLGALFLLHWLGPGGGVIVLSAAALIGAALLGRPRTALLLLVAGAALAMAFPSLTDVRVSEYKDITQALRFPGARHIKRYEDSFSRVDVFKSPMARFAPGLSLTYLSPLPQQLGITVDGGSISAITNASAVAGEAGFLRHLPAALPYEMRPRNDVLVIDPGGGLEILLARAYGARGITSVESNPLLLKVIRDDYARLSGNIYADSAFPGMGRTYLKATEKKFDLIDISRMSAVPTARLGMAEDYSFTVEAVRGYLGGLGRDGVLSVNLYLLPPPRAELRVLTTGLRALGEMGVGDASRHVAAIRTWGSMTILFKVVPFTPAEIEGLRRFTREMGFDRVYYPGIGQDETNQYVKLPTSAYYHAFKSIIGTGTREAFINDYVFDIRETRDLSPFFHDYLRLGRLGSAYDFGGGKWQFFLDQGYLMPLVLAQAVLLSLLILVLPALRRRKHSGAWPAVGPGGPKGPGPPWAVLGYFCLLGLGFMFVEVPMIQAMILPLGNPSHAVAAVLASVLISSGAGSLLSGKFKALSSPRALLVLSLAIVAYAIVLTSLAGSVSLPPRHYRFAVVFVLMLPAGLLMGIPFPMGMRLLGRTGPGLIPWAWAANGCFSVIAPVLAAMLSEATGFRTVMLLGALAYASAYLMLKKMYLRK